MANDLLSIKRALISVSDKTGVVDLAKRLAKRGVEIISTGGTAKALVENGIKVIPIEQVTGNPECFQGRMKTISFAVESAILFRRGDASDERDARALGIVGIDLVVCNLYPFEQVAKAGHSDEVLIENIDIGGPTMVRAAAKNFASVCVLTNPAQYEELSDDFVTSFELRRKWALAAFAMTAAYDGYVANTLAKRFASETTPLFLKATPDVTPLRYGENPHQKAKLYFTDAQRSGIVQGQVLQGKELSYNNWVDADSAYKCASDLFYATKKEAVVIVKHANPCGAAAGTEQLLCLQDAWEGDPVSSFGSVIAFTAPIEESSALWLKERFVEVIVAPSFSEQALKVFNQKKNLRLIACPPLTLGDGKRETVIKSLSGGGLLLQDEDEGPDLELQTVTKVQFSEAMRSLASFGIMATKHLRSNGIGLCAIKGENLVLVGTGMGQPNRIDSLARLACPRAGEKPYVNFGQLLLISDAFFPFADSIEHAQRLGLKYIVQPGGSIRDAEVIAACDQYGIAMMLTGRRHFRH